MVRFVAVLAGSALSYAALIAALAWIIGYEFPEGWA